MNECLVTKLKSCVSDNELYRIGELRGNITVDNPNSQFVLKGLNPNPGKEYVVTVEYNFKDGTTKKDFVVQKDISFFQYALEVSLTKGKIFKVYPKYYFTEIRLDSVHIDFSELQYCKSLRLVSGLTGEGINDLSYLYGIEGFSVYSCALQSGGAKVIGDLSKMPKSFCYMLATSGMQELTWANNRPSDANIISMNYINLGNFVDAMLINQANCKAVDSIDLDFNFKKIINVFGTRTSASDAAVETLKSKGYTVKVNNVEL